MEYGPRSLGNRAILADARNPNMKEIINSKIKKRENFRPFAPSILVEKKNEWFESLQLNNYMSFVEKIKSDKQKLIPAVCHVDGTGRVQTVSKETNKKFYGLINNFYKKTGVPILLNTSFNENEPIVMKPEEAIECFERTRMDMLILNNFVVLKTK
jgi:carbamoyltransferase